MDNSRIVALARTHLAAAASGNGRAAKALRAGANALAGEEGFLGYALHEERTLFRETDPSVSSSFLELAFFRNVVPQAATGWALARPEADVELLRVDLIDRTPGSFHGPLLGSQEHLSRPGFMVSLEYIDVRFSELDRYRDVMKGYCGPAAAQLVEAGTLGSFRALESVGTLFRSDKAQPGWNQLHLFEVSTEALDSFFAEFDRAIRNASGSDFATVFGGLDEIRSVPRWVFCSLEQENTLLPS